MPRTRSKPTKGTTDELMSWPVGAKPWTVRVYERTDREGAVYIHWRDKATGNAKRKGLKGFPTIRKKTGAIETTLRSAAIRQATEWQEQWELGAPEPMDQEEYIARMEAAATEEAERQARVARGEEEDTGPAPERLVPSGAVAIMRRATYSLRDMFADVLGPAIPKGKHLRRKIRGQFIPAGPSGGGPWYKTYTQFSVERRDSATVVEEILGANTKVSALKNASVSKIVDTLAREAEAEGRTTGWKKAEHAVDVFYFALRRARQDDNTTVPNLEPLTGWKKKIRRDWADATKDRGPRETKRPRHQDIHAARLYRAIEEKLGPWRVRLALALGGPARLGQVARSLRSQVDLDAPNFAHGSFQIEDRGEKKGTLYSLTEWERGQLDDALTTHLKPFEEAYKAGVIPDYSLVPKGRTYHHVYRVVLGRMYGHVSATRLHEEFNLLEQAAGVDYVKGRGWLGLRRLFTDLHANIMAKKLQYADERVLDSITGHTPTDLRQGIYQDVWRIEVLEPAAEVRRYTVEHLLAMAPTLSKPSENIAPGLHRTIGAWSKEKRRKAAVARKEAKLKAFLGAVAHKAPTGS